jgi:hypothetical protein
MRMVGVVSVSAGLVIFLRTEVPNKVYIQTAETIEVTPNPLKFGNIARLTEGEHEKQEVNQGSLIYDKTPEKPH